MRTLRTALFALLVVTVCPAFAEEVIVEVSGTGAGSQGSQGSEVTPSTGSGNTR